MTEEHEFHLDEWLSSGARGVHAKLSETRLLPEAFWEHSWAAGRESLLAVRSLLDAVIERTERKPKRVTKIRVEKAD